MVVSIDKQSSDRLDLNNNPDKWPRSLHAQLTENLTREGARVVAFDVHFIEPKNAEDDNLFAQSLQNAQNVILTEPLVPKELFRFHRARCSSGTRLESKQEKGRISRCYLTGGVGAR